MSARCATSSGRVIRFHTKSRTGCLTCRKRKVKCDETAPVCRSCHRCNLICIPRPKTSDKQQRQQVSVLYKPLTAPTPSSFTLDATSLRIFHHFTNVTAFSISSDSTHVAESILFLPQLLFNPACMHALLALTALHMGRLYERSSSPDSQNWITRASTHRNAAIRLIRTSSLNPKARFVASAFLSVYTVFLMLSSPVSSPANIFSLVTLLHDICSPLKRFVCADPWLQSSGFGRPGPSAASSALNSSTGFLAPLYHLCDSSTAFGSDREELNDPDIKGAYRTAVYGLFVVHSLAQRGLEGRSPFFWPALFGKRFAELLNERRQRALVILYYYLMMLRNLRERCWWASEVGRWVDYVYGLIDECWKEWLREVSAAEKVVMDPHLDKR